MPSVPSLLCVPFVAFTRKSTSRRSVPRLASGLLRLVPVVVFVAAAAVSGGQTAHFDGVQTNVSAGGSNILAIAVDAAGDVIFSAQNPYAVAALRPSLPRYVPAAFQSTRSRRLTDGGRGVTARVMRASSCTYSGATGSLFFKPANSSSLYLMSGINAPSGLALDSSGNLYVLDAYSAAIYKYASVNGAVDPTSAPQFVTPAQGDNCSNGDMTMDALGNLYYTTSSGNAVEEVLAVNGVIPQSPAIQSLGSGFNYPLGIAVDGSGNVYVADAMNNAVKELVAVGGTVPSSPTILTLGSGFNLPAGVALDASGNVYVSDYNNSQLKEMLAVNGSIPSSPIIEVLGNFSQTEAVALDGSGDVFVGDAVNNSGTVSELLLTAANFGEVNIGVAAPAISMQFTFDTAGTLATVTVLTQGAPGLDYSNAGSGTCAANTTYSEGQSCTVDVKLTPAESGTRNGAVVLTGSNGNVIATGYLQGTGMGPQVNFAPGAESAIQLAAAATPSGVAIDGTGSVFVADSNSQTVVKETPGGGSYSQTTIATGLTEPNQVAVDGAANVYIADKGNMRVLQETPTGAGYVQSTVDSGFGSPNGVALDVSGNVYIADGSNNRILKETLSQSGYARTVVVNGLSNPTGVAVDGAGNLYIAEANNGSGTLLKETLSNGTYTQSTIPAAGQFDPGSIAVDGLGNVYFVDTATGNIFKEVPTANGYVESSLIGDLHLSPGPRGIAVDQNGNVYTGYPALNEVVKVDFADAPTLTFASTPVGTTSADSPQTVTVQNNGNAALVFPIPTSGNNPSIGPDFTLNSQGQTDCPLLNSQSPAAASLGPGGACQLSVSFAPTVSGSLAESLVLTDDNLNAGAPAYATQTVTLTGTAVIQSTPSITWPTPVAISYGTALSAVQLDATANVPGTFTYSPVAGTVPGVGTQALTVTFTPTDTTDYTTATATVSLTVNQATPSVTWPAPAAITYGTALGSSQLDASSTVAGTFSYSPVAGTVPGVGTQALTVTFTPTDTTDYTTATATVSLTVNKATSSVTWPAPAAIVYGAALSAAQLDATASVPGTFTYSPAAGTVLSAGTQRLSATFNPTDSADYAPVSSTVVLTVNKATPTITWPTPAAIVAGTALSSTQLDATASVPGTFAYSPAAGTVLAAGNQTLTTAFTPSDSADYNTATASVVLQVTPPPSFTLSVSSPSLTLLSGNKVSDTVTVNGQNGFNSSATLSVSGLPSGVTATFGTNPTKASSVLTFAASSSAKSGTYSVLVNGVAGSLSASTTISLTVTRK